MTLQAAKAADLSTVLNWLTSEQECRLWAGPNVRYPATPASAWAEMEASEQNAYALVDAEGVIMGFGQILLREGGVVHLARLMVDPALRGQGMGRALCLALMKQGASQHYAITFTLNVYKSNKAAFHLYQSLGFVEKNQIDSGAIAMSKPITKD